MPTLRWFGRRPVTSRPSIWIAPEVGYLEAGHHAQGRGLAAAGRAEEGDELAALDIEVELLHHGLLAEVLAHVAEISRNAMLTSPFDAARSGRAP